MPLGHFNAKESLSFLPTKRGFKLASLNITSLPKHIDELRVLLADRPVDVLSINETRLDNSVADSDVNIPGYEIIRRDRMTNGRFGGGVCFYVRTSVNYCLRSDFNINQLENLCIEICKPIIPSLFSSQLGIDLPIPQLKFSHISSYLLVSSMQII
jgi:hypothetical protein